MTVFDHGPSDTCPDAHATTAVWSCVLDDTPRIWACFVPWLASLMINAKVPAERIIVHHVCALPKGVADVLSALGIATRHIPRFANQYPHANKIAQCATDFPDVDNVILTDVDTAFVGPLPVSRVRSDLAAKPVDHPCPPVEILCSVFAEAGLQPPNLVTRHHASHDGTRVEFQTFANNFNGGLYVIERKALAELGKAWAYWARWLMTRSTMLDKWAVHLDQVSFALATSALGLVHETLPDAWNQPTHHKTLSAEDQPLVLHHHGTFSEGVRLSAQNVLWAQPVVESVNRATDALLRLHPSLGDILCDGLHAV